MPIAGLTDDVKQLLTRQLRAGFVFLPMILWESPGATGGSWELPPYFLANHRVLMGHARDAGLGVLSLEEQAENWKGGHARARAIVTRWGIAFPAQPGAGHRRRGRGRRHQPRRHHPGVLMTTRGPAGHAEKIFITVRNVFAA